LAQTLDDSRFKESLIAYSKKDFSKAIQLLSPLVKEHPKKSIYWFNLANSQFMSKQYPAAIASFDQVIKLKAKFVDISFVYKAKALKKLGMHDEAKLELGKAKSTPNISGATKSLLKTEQAALEEISDVELESLALYQTSQWLESEEKLKTLDIENLSKNGRILLALALFKQKKIAEAEQFIHSQPQASRQSPWTTGQTNELLRELLKKARQKDISQEPRWVFLDLSYGQTSNVYFEGKSGSQISSPLIRSALGAGYHFNSESKESQKIGYTFNLEDTKQAPELATYSHTLQTSAHLDDPSRSLSASLFFSSQALSYSLASEKLGTNLKAIYTFGETETIFSADISKLEPKQESLSYLGGHSFSLRAAYGVWKPTSYGQISLTLGQEQIGDLTFADGSILPMRKDYYGVSLSGVWNFSPKTSVIAGLSLTQHKYKNDEVPDSKKRLDDDTNIFIKVTNSITPTLLLYLTGEQKNNRSSLGANDVWDKNYDVTTISVGVSWDGI
jgi:tetratricopeptide (TPR) repeat protein